MVNEHALIGYRRSQKITQRQLAQLIGVRDSTVCKWETGRARIPAERVPSLCEALGCEPADLRPDLFPAGGA